MLDNQLQSYFDYFQNYEELVDQAASYIQAVIQKHKCE